MLLSVAITLVIAFVFYNLMSKITHFGLDARNHLLGLKEYLQIAEKDRLAFHHAPEKNPKVFESLLPFAMVFGVEKAWAKEFQDIYTAPPTWYQGFDGTFSAAVLANSLHSFSTVSAPSSSGASGGGGFAGGGGGGGGGGSW